MERLALILSRIQKKAYDIKQVIQSQMWNYTTTVISTSGLSLSQWSSCIVTVELDHGSHLYHWTLPADSVTVVALRHDSRTTLWQSTLPLNYLYIHNQMWIYTLSNRDIQSKWRKDWQWFSRDTKRKCMRSNCSYRVKCRHKHCQMKIYSQNSGKTGTDSLRTPKENVWDHTVHTQSNADICTVKRRHAVKQQKDWQVKLCIHSQMKIHSQNSRKTGTDSLMNEKKCVTSNKSYTVKCGTTMRHSSLPVGSACCHCHCGGATLWHDSHPPTGLCLQTL